MKRFNTMHVVMTSTILCLALGLSACDQIGSADSDVATEASARAAYSTSPVVTIPPPFEDYDGESTLIRTKNGINFSFTTSGLNPGHAYTLWFVAFNAPENCLVPGCIPPDLLRPETMADMMYGAGHVVGGSGQATFSGRMKVGDTSGSVLPPIDYPADGLTSPYGATIHLVVRDHGPKIAAFMPDMIKSLAGGCLDAAQGPTSPWNMLTGSGDYADELGRLGPNTCSSDLLSVHQL